VAVRSAVIDMFVNRLLKEAKAFTEGQGTIEEAAIAAKRVSDFLRREVRNRREEEGRDD